MLLCPLQTRCIDFSSEFIAGKTANAAGVKQHIMQRVKQRVAAIKLASAAGVERQEK